MGIAPRSRALALTVVMCFLVTSCTAQKPLTAHWDDTPTLPAHDESRIEGVGTVMAFPNGQKPERIAVRYDVGGMLELGCDGQAVPCPNVTVKVTGFNPEHLPEGWKFAPPTGVYKMARSDDPNIFVVKDSDGHIAAYYVVNKFNPQKSVVVNNYNDAIAAENEGEGWHYTGKATRVHGADGASSRGCGRRAVGRGRRSAAGTAGAATSSGRTAFLDDLHSL